MVNIEKIKMNTNEKNQDEDNLMEVLQHLIDMIDTCVETKQPDQLEITLGDDKLGDKIVVDISYIKKEKDSKKEGKLLN